MAARLWMMSIQGTVLIGVVFVLRMLMRRYPKKYSYMLWLLVLVRLLCPVFIESGVSLQPDLQHYVSGERQGTKDGNLDKGNPSVVLMPAMAEAVQAAREAAVMAESLSGLVPADPGQEEEREQEGVGLAERQDAEHAIFAEKDTVAWPEEAMQLTQNIADFPEIPEKQLDWKNLFQRLHIFGCFVVMSFFGIQYLRLKRQMKTAIRMAGEVWLCEFIGSPFVLGVFRPLIYLPYGIPKEEEGYILRHERMHIRHQDPLLRLFGLAALCLHWWNPAVWFAIHKMNQDMEMYCDEAVLAEAEMREKKEYSTALLHYSMRRSKMAAALAFGESNTEKRVRNIMRKKRRSVTIAGGFLLVGLLCVILFLTVPKTKAEGENKQNGTPVEDAKDGNTDKEDNIKSNNNENIEKNDNAEKNEKNENDEKNENTEKNENIGKDKNTEKDSNAAGNSSSNQDEWQLLEDFALAYPDENGIVESKILPDMMQPGSEIYFIDDTHFIILSGGIYYDTQEKVDEYKEAWKQRILEAEENGTQRGGPYRPKAGDFIDYTDRGYAHRIYEGYTLEQAQQRALWPESAQKFGIQLQHQEDAPWIDLTDITEITIRLQDEDRNEYTLPYQYDLTGAGHFDGKVLFTDINFDGKEDILIDLGRYGNQGVQYYACFVWSEEEQNYARIPEFEKIPNPTPVGGDKQRILGLLRDNAASYQYLSYSWDGLKLVEENGLYVTYSEDSRAEPKEITGWKNEEKSPILDGAALFAAWQEDLAHWSLDKEENAKVIFSRTMWNPDSRQLEGAWKITERVGTTPIYGLTEKEEEATIGTEIVYRNRLHKQLQEGETEYYISILPFEDTKRWMISYQRMDAVCMQILSCETELLTPEEFVESFRALDIAGTEDMLQYEITDAYDEPYGQHCFLLTDGKMLIYRDGVFFLAEKE